VPCRDIVRLLYAPQNRKQIIQNLRWRPLKTLILMKKCHISPYPRLNTRRQLNALSCKAIPDSNNNPPRYLVIIGGIKESVREEMGRLIWQNNYSHFGT
jgi:hypothetical protein